MRTSKMGRNSRRSTGGRGVVAGLAGLLGLGVCLGISSASAGDATQVVSPQASAQGSLGPQRAAITTQQSAAATTTYVANPERRRWIITGASTLGGFWTASALYGAALSLEQREARLVPQCTKCACSLVPQRGRIAPSPTSLLIPVAGPWIHLGTGRHSAAGAVGLSVLGAGQAVGLGMLLGGVALPRLVRVPVQRGRVLQMGAAPLVTADGLGLSIHGSM